MPFATRIILAACAIAAPLAVSAQSLANFETQTGLCTGQQIRSLVSSEDDFEGFTYTVEAAEILQTRGLSPLPTDTFIPPITGLACHYLDKDNGLILVSAETSPNYCGWIDVSTVLIGRQNQGDVFGENGACGSISPMSVADYCADMADLGENVSDCADPRLATAPFDTKFIVYNAYQDNSAAGISPVEIPLYATAEGSQTAGVVKIFNVLRVFSVAMGPDGVRYLVGSSERKMLGWIDADSGAVWYSKLATFFAETGEAPVLLDVPHAGENIVVATAPDNIRAMLEQERDFRKYPVLLDRRQELETDPLDKDPYLEIAFIGSFCDTGSGVLCAEGVDTSVATDLSVLNQADTLFLIDGTKSMERYFGLVSLAVDELTSEYQGLVEYKFGASLYGDFTEPGKRGPSDPLQYREEIPLGTILSGREFAVLPDAELFIEDAQRDKPEAANAALLRAVETTAWSGEAPRFIIHIADHGDRTPPSQALLDAMKREKILYFPIAVRGDSVIDASRNFVNHSAEIRTRHVTDEGFPMASGVSQTYSGTEAVSDQVEYDAISAALFGALQLAEEVRRDLIDVLYGREATDEDAELAGSRFPPGYAGVTKAAAELFLGRDISEEGLSIEARTIAARGYIPTAAIREPESDWEYYAAIRPADLGDLRKSFDRVCKSIKDSNARQDFAEALQDAISVLTGDELRDQETFRAYFAERGNIPLASEIVLGEGLIGLARDLGNPNAEARISQYQKEVCRSAKLFSLMDARRQLPVPYDQAQRPDGNLIWQDASQSYVHTGDRRRDWLYQDDFGRLTVFLPLSYLPRPATDF